MLISDEKIQIVPYDHKWPKMYEEEAKIIESALGENFISINHIGSTSVPGIHAKPKIDIIVAVKDLKKSRNQLKKVSMTYRGEYNIPLHYFFTKRDSVDINLHVYENNNPEIELNIAFRNYLREHEVTRNEYTNLKKKLVKDKTSFDKKSHNLPAYTLRKGDFIRSVLKKIGFAHLRVLRCSDDTEWKIVKKLRQEYFLNFASIDDPYTDTFNYKQHQHFILYKGTEIIGYSHIQLLPNKRSLIRILIINEESQNKDSDGEDFGGKFISIIEKWLKSQGYKIINAKVSPEALDFYKKHNYKKMPFDDQVKYKHHPEGINIGKII